MRKPHNLSAAVLVTFVLSLSPFAQAQQPPGSSHEDRDRGIQLYQRGDAKGAISALSAAVKKSKGDGEAWYYLGLARLKRNDSKNARKAFEVAVHLLPDFVPAHTSLSRALLFTSRVAEAENEVQRALSLEPQNAEAHYLLGTMRLMKGSCEEAALNAAAALKSAPSFAVAYLLKSQSLVCIYAKNSLQPYIFDGTVFKTTAPQGVSREEKLAAARKAAQQFKEAADDLEKFLQLEPDSQDAPMWRDQLDALRVQAEPAEKSDSERTVFTPAEVTTKLRVLAKPKAGYTAAAREAQIEGTVVLRAVFANDGTVKHVLVLNSLPKGLTQQAIKAAHRITFIPAEIEGRRVSTLMTLEYLFNLY